MNTFIIERDFVKNASILDRQRLNKQRVEARNILVLLIGKPEWCSEKQYHYLAKRYKVHPCVLQWKSNEICLLDYTIKICQEWKKRGYEDHCLEQSIETCKPILGEQDPFNLKYVMPWWLDSGFIGTHRSALLYKNIRHYKQFNDKWFVNPIINYYWPVKKENLEASIAQQKIHIENQNRKGKINEPGSIRSQYVSYIDSSNIFRIPTRPRPIPRAPTPPPVPVEQTLTPSQNSVGGILPIASNESSWITFSTAELRNQVSESYRRQIEAYYSSIGSLNQPLTVDSIDSISPPPPANPSGSEPGVIRTRNEDIFNQEILGHFATPTDPLPPPVPVGDTMEILGTSSDYDIYDDYSYPDEEP